MNPDRTRPPDPTRAPDRNRTIARILFWLALIGATALALMPYPPHLPTDRFGDKFNHVLAFAVLATLAVPAFPAMPRLRLIERLSFLGAMIELVQSIPWVHRDCDIRDWIADTLAVIVATLVTAALVRRKPS